ncbi:unnamed protein product [Gordionus sp. m RMFG-2023]
MHLTPYVTSYTTLTLVLTLIITTLGIIYLALRPYYILKKCGLLYPTPVYPIFGHQLALMMKGFQICHSHWRDQLFPSNNDKNGFKGKNQLYKIYAICDGLDYSVVIADPKILEYILIRDFHSFPNRKLMILHQKCVAKSVIAQPYDDWKENRRILIKTFTTSMMKQMILENVRCTVELMEKAGLTTTKVEYFNVPSKLSNENQISHEESYIRERHPRPKIPAEKIAEKCKSKRENPSYPLIIDGKTPFEAKTLFGVYAIDMITRNTLGFKLKFGTPEHTRFLENTHLIFTYQMYRFILLRWLQPLASLISTLFKVSFVGEASLLYIRDVIRKFVDVRLKSNVNRKDLYQIMLNAARKNMRKNSADDLKGCPFGDDSVNIHNQNKINYNMENVEANSIFIILATYDTLSTALSWIVYHLAQNSQMQDRIYQEIMTQLRAPIPDSGYTDTECSTNSEDDILTNDKNVADLDSNDKYKYSQFSKVDYKFLKRLRYTEMFVKEVLRHDPPLAIINRVASEDYTIPIEDCDIKIQKGTLIDVPIYAIHHDPEYWPDPELLDPERFEISFKNFNSYNKFAYMPFGLGPRNCAAEKFAILTIKAFLAVALQKMEFKKCHKTLNGYTPYETPFKKNEFHYPKCGIWLVAHPRI